MRRCSAGENGRVVKFHGVLHDDWHWTILCYRFEGKVYYTYNLSSSYPIPFPQLSRSLTP